MSLFFGLLMGLLAGPVLALAVKSPANQKGYAARKLKFEEGKGRNPDLAPFGPHKSFAQNALMFGLMFFAIGAAIGMMVG